MIQSIKNKITDYRQSWQYENEMDVENIYYLWECLKMWWGLRPVKIECACCHRLMWWNGNQGKHYCSEGCAYYGPMPKPQTGPLTDDEIPF